MTNGDTERESTRRGEHVERGKPSSAPVVLVVDDDPDMRAYLRRCVSPVAARVVEAKDGAEALTLVREAGPGGFDLVITDVVMPGLDGLALRRALAGDPALRSTAVLLITGESYVPGAESILRKPFNSVTLRRRVNELLQEPGAGSS